MSNMQAADVSAGMSELPGTVYEKVQDLRLRNLSRRELLPFVWRRDGVRGVRRRVVGVRLKAECFRLPEFKCYGLV